MNEKERRLAIKNFSSNSEDAPTVFLLSMKAGGVGINLTAATRVFLMDPVNFFIFYCLGKFQV